MVMRFVAFNDHAGRGGGGLRSQHQSLLRVAAREPWKEVASVYDRTTDL
jgi:hypothetical protein